MKRVTPVLALGALLLTALPAHATDNGPTHRDSYGTKAVYSLGQNPRTYQQAPAGYTAVFTENVSRHGSRSATDGEDGETILALWNQAEADGQLTRLGKEFGPDVQALEAAMSTIGYGNLSGRGKDELRATAVRLEKRLPSLFSSIAENGEKIDVVSSGQGRAVDSGTVFATAHQEEQQVLRPERTGALLRQGLTGVGTGGDAYRRLQGASPGGGTPSAHPPPLSASLERGDPHRPSGTTTHGQRAP
ncbi:histidine-type phosphatase [Streptomyces sp. NPDC048417]|uniref:histidine-type phosphatase n=1 Tax=Streptomyces sp. NPDC048417 TaxID=3155387 RepID=UPI003440556A